MTLLPAFCPKFNILFVADLQPSHLSSSLHGKSEAYEHRLLHVHRARALCTHVPGKSFFFLNMKPDPCIEFESIYSHTG